MVKYFDKCAPFGCPKVVLMVATLCILVSYHFTFPTIVNMKKSFITFSRSLRLIASKLIKKIK